MPIAAGKAKKPCSHPTGRRSGRGRGILGGLGNPGRDPLCAHRLYLAPGQFGRIGRGFGFRGRDRWRGGRVFDGAKPLRQDKSTLFATFGKIETVCFGAGANLRGVCGFVGRLAAGPFDILFRKALMRVVFDREDISQVGHGILRFGSGGTARESVAVGVENFLEKCHLPVVLDAQSTAVAACQ